MILKTILNREKWKKFVQIWRQDGPRHAMSIGLGHLKARARGAGLTSLFHRGGAPAPNPASYLSLVWLELAEKDAFHITTAPAILHRRRKIAMIGDLNLAQCRKYRVEQPAEIWAGLDVDYGFSHYEDMPRAVSLLQDATHAMFYRLPSAGVTSVLAYEARRLKLPILYDLDDPLFSVSAYGTYQNMAALPAWQKAHFMTEAPRYLDVMNGSDVITVSTPGLVAHTRIYTPRPVHMRRNFADRITLDAGAKAMTKAARRATDGPFRLGFASGSQGHEIDFAEIADDMITFLAAQPDRQLVILGHFNKTLMPPDLAARVEVHPFTDYTDYLETLASLDVAVMPLADDLFNRSKSAVRVIDAASVGVPSVVNTVCDMAAMVEDGQTGRVLAPGASWAAALEALAQDRAATRTMGRAARHRLETHWSASTETHIIDPEIIDWVRT